MPSLWALRRFRRSDGSGARTVRAGRTCAAASGGGGGSPRHAAIAALTSYSSMGPDAGGRPAREAQEGAQGAVGDRENKQIPFWPVRGPREVRGWGPEPGKKVVTACH